ncbi:MAG: hypothetical protein ACRD1C_14265 [Terriglobales bacterium]
MTRQAPQDDGGRALRIQVTQSVIAIFGVFALLDYLLASSSASGRAPGEVHTIVSIFAFAQAAMWLVGLVLAERVYSWRSPPANARSRRTRAVLTTIVAIGIFVGTFVGLPRLVLR